MVNVQEAVWEAVQEDAEETAQLVLIVTPLAPAINN